MDPSSPEDGCVRLATRNTEEVRMDQNNSCTSELADAAILGEPSAMVNDMNTSNTLHDEQGGGGAFQQGISNNSPFTTDSPNNGQNQLHQVNEIKNNENSGVNFSDIETCKPVAQVGDLMMLESSEFHTSANGEEGGLEQQQTKEVLADKSMEEVATTVRDMEHTKSVLDKNAMDCPPMTMEGSDREEAGLDKNSHRSNNCEPPAAAEELVLFETSKAHMNANNEATDESGDLEQQTHKVHDKSTEDCPPLIVPNNEREEVSKNCEPPTAGDLMLFETSEMCINAYDETRDLDQTKEDQENVEDVDATTSISGNAWQEVPSDEKNGSNSNNLSRNCEPPAVLADLGMCATSELSATSSEEGDLGQNEKVGHKNTDDAPFDSTTPNSDQRRVVCERWTRFTDLLHTTVVGFVVALSLVAARNPRTCIASIVLVSFTLIAVGLFTNFRIEVDEKVLYAPFKSLPQQHKNWLDKESGFTDSTRSLSLILHNDGENLVGIEEMRLVFQALDTVRNTTGYNDICQDGAYWDSYQEEFTCRIISATRTWYHDYGLFESQVKTQQDLVDALSLSEYPGGAPKNPTFVMGNLEYEDGNSTVVSYVPAYFLSILLSDKGEQTEEFEALVIENILELRADWNQNGSKVKIELFTQRSFKDEFQRAIHRDMYLLPIIAFLMAGFTCLVFFKKDRVQSRCLLGVGSVFTITMSLCSGFGLLFIIGVPFSNMTQLLVFIIYGVGLDDTFIIMGAYFRTDPKRDTLERLRETMQEVGASIAATTITTSSAFILGLISTVPAIRWLCLYAFPTILIVFLYQITLFVGFLILDERRIRANRKDCCGCSCCPGQQSGEVEESGNTTSTVDVSSKHMADRVMAWYGKKLMIPAVKGVVIVIFAAFFAVCTYQTTKLTQAFDVKELLPEGSYASGALIAMDDYQEKTYDISITFRDVNQSDPVVQQQMLDFIDDITNIDAFGEEPPFCWVRDFQKLKDTEFYDAIAGLTFQQQVLFALEQPALKEVYEDDMVVDEQGNILSSRCKILATNTYLDYVDTTIDLLLEQREVTNEQPINQGRKREALFTYHRLYSVWEFYSIAVDELISTTVSSVIAVNVVAVIFIPHWSAVLFLIPIISIIFIDMMGVLHMAGLHINAVTYVCLVISIGLIVDFLMHVLLRYFESSHKDREERVKVTLETMGASILLGGVSTLLGALPLVFSTSTILITVFTCFCSMVVLGCSHGLILLPVVLSIAGPIPQAGEPLSQETLRDEGTSTHYCSSGASSEDSPSKNKNNERSASLEVPPKSAEEREEAVKHFLRKCAKEMASATYPQDDRTAQREKAELIEYYLTIYRTTTEPEEFLEQLRDEVNAKIESTMEVSC